MRLFRGGQLEHAGDRPRGALADVLAQPRDFVRHYRAAMSTALRVEKEHQSQANARTDTKFLHRFLHKN